MSDFWHILLFCPKQTVVLSEPEITFFSSDKSRSDKDKVYIYVAKSYWLTVITILYFYIIILYYSLANHLESSKQTLLNGY